MLSKLSENACLMNFGAVFIATCLVESCGDLQDSQAIQ